MRHHDRPGAIEPRAQRIVIFQKAGVMENGRFCPNKGRVPGGNHPGQFQGLGNVWVNRPSFPEHARSDKCELKVENGGKCCNLASHR
jgi:hypothetical protein